MLSKLAIASARCAPIVTPALSPNCGTLVAGVSTARAVAPPAGVGVDGTAAVIEDELAGAGAAGVEGVTIGAVAGVAGVIVAGAFEDVATGAEPGLGYEVIRTLYRNA